MNNIAKNLKHIREPRGMTQEQLAAELNVTRQAVSNWENGKTEPDIETLGKIAGCLGTTIEELIYGSPKHVMQNITHVHRNIQIGAKEGVGFGAVLAIVISYVKWHSIGWAILHGLLNWIYVIYYALKYGFEG